MFIFWNVHSNVNKGKKMKRMRFLFFSLTFVCCDVDEILFKRRKSQKIKAFIEDDETNMRLFFYSKNGILEWI